MTEEKYLIGNKEFVLRDDLSFEEIDRVEEFTNPFKAVGKKIIESSRKYTSKEIVEFVKMLLNPIDGSNKDDFDWKQLTPDQSVNIIADFLKKKAQENVIITTSSKIYNKGIAMQLQHTTH